MLTLTWIAAAGNDGGGSKSWQTFLRGSNDLSPTYFHGNKPKIWHSWLWSPCFPVQKVVVETPFHGNLCKTHQRMERWKKLREYLRVNFGNLKIPLELSKKTHISGTLHLSTSFLKQLGLLRVAETWIRGWVEKKPRSCSVGFFLLNIQPNSSGHELKASRVFLWAFVRVCQVFEGPKPEFDPFIFSWSGSLKVLHTNEPTPFCWSHLVTPTERSGWLGKWGFWNHTTKHHDTIRALRHKTARISVVEEI